MSRYDDPDSPDYQETNVGLGMVPERKKAPADPVGGMPSPGDEVLASYKLAERCVKPSSMYGATVQQLARALLTSKEILMDFAESYEAMKTRAKKAERELGEARFERQNAINTANELDAAVTKAEREVAGLRADAERYRWLKAEDRKALPRATISWRQLYGMSGGNFPCKLSDGDDLDALIDVALKEPKND